jgi:hypothetical protein
MNGPGWPFTRSVDPVTGDHRYGRRLAELAADSHRLRLETRFWFCENGFLEMPNHKTR